MALTVAQVSSLVINNIQMLTDEMGLNVAVGPISDDDWLFFSQGNSKLNWDSLLTSLANDSNCFSMTLKLRDCESKQLLGASLSLCDFNKSAIDIHAIEHFLRNDELNQIKGRMLFLTISAALMFALVASIKIIKVIDIEESIIPLYEKYGFRVLTRVPEIIMTVDIDDVQRELSNMINEVKNYEHKK